MGEFHDKAGPDSERKRRRFRLSLRLMMLAILVLGTWLGWRIQRAKAQRRAYEAIMRVLGAMILYDWQRPESSGKTASTTGPPGPAFLRRALGDEYFQEITFVAFMRRGPKSRLPFGTLEALANLPNLKSLNLSAVEVSADELDHLAGMTTLSFLSLPNVPMTDQESVHLAHLTNLEELHLENTPIDRGTIHLNGLGKLKALALSGSNLGDEGLEPLAMLPNLEVLAIYNTRVSEAAVRRFRERRADVKIFFGAKP